MWRTATEKRAKKCRNHHIKNKNRPKIGRKMAERKHVDIFNLFRRKTLQAFLIIFFQVLLFFFCFESGSFFMINFGQFAFVFLNKLIIQQILGARICKIDEQINGHHRQKSTSKHGDESPSESFFKIDALALPQ